ncbi:MAG TPA: NAD(P)/FAD-dependent oxidoreductase [Vicinamibacterales bacterium]|nr:NAD(P)/FAD-dependent oxidoreductase [Vicinamibacterales bacterium]
MNRARAMFRAGPIPIATEMGTPRVVIIGGGFGGVAAARALSKAPVDVVLIDRTNHYLFQPLLYQVAAGLLSPADIAVPTRSLLHRQRNVDVVMGDVHSIDVQRRSVVASGIDAPIPYDFLIVATGARHSYFAHPEWERSAPGLKTLDDARQIRSRFLLAFEEAEKERDPVAQSALATFVIIGGGPTGVELAGILPTLARRGLRRDYRHVDPARSKVILLEGGPRILPTFCEDISRRAQRDLEELGVQVRTNALVTDLQSDAVYVGDEMIPARSVFWAAGNQASPLIKALGAPMDRAGRALVNTDLSIPDHPEIFVIGDAAAAARSSSAPKASGGAQWVPGLAAAANQMGAHAGAMIARSVNGLAREPFTFADRGMMAIIGRNRAVAAFGGVTLTGRLAFLTWLFVHVLYLASFRNRVSVLLEWGYAYLTSRPGARLLTMEDRARVIGGAQASDRRRLKRTA